MLSAMFYFKASSGRYEHLFVDVDLVFVNPNVVEIFASSKKHTLSKIPLYTNILEHVRGP